MTHLHAMTAAWQLWASTAPRDEDGWQSSYPDWAALIHTACQTMIGPLESSSVRDLQLIWAAAEEGEELLDFARSRLAAVQPWLMELSRAPEAAVRWQVYDALLDAAGSPWAEAILRGGISDPDPYARRRAFLALCSSGPADCAELVDTLSRDSDAENRRIAITRLRTSS